MHMSAAEEGECLVISVDENRIDASVAVRFKDQMPRGRLLWYSHFKAQSESQFCPSAILRYHNQFGGGLCPPSMV